MTHQFEQELTQLRRDFIAHAASCFEAVERAHEVLRDRNVVLAKQVVEGDDQVDEAEIRIESQCVRLMTLHHPVAHDMRLLITLLKMNDELERVADHASNICWLATRIVQRGGAFPPHLLELSGRVVGSSRTVLQAFLDSDVERARSVMRGDTAVDALDRTVRHEVHDLLAGDAEVGSALHVFRISRELERVGDHLANMAEDTIYLITGEIVRHHALAWGLAGPGRATPLSS